MGSENDDYYQTGGANKTMGEGGGGRGERRGEGERELYKLKRDDSCKQERFDK